MLALTSAAVTSWPLWNLTPLRSLKSIVMSSTTFHDSARAGTILPSQSRSTSESNTFMRTEMPTSWLAKNGCGLSISEMVSILSVPVRLDTAGAAVGCAAAAGGAVVGTAAGAVVAGGADVGLGAGGAVQAARSSTTIRDR